MPLGKKYFAPYEKIRNLVPLCVSTSGQRKFAPSPYEILMALKLLISSFVYSVNVYRAGKESFRQRVGDLMFPWNWVRRVADVVERRCPATTRRTLNTFCIAACQAAIRRRWWKVARIFATAIRSCICVQ